MNTKQGKADKGRFSAKRKTQAVLRLLRGEDLETLSRELGVTASRLSQWRDDFLANGEAGLKSRQPDARDDEIGDHGVRVLESFDLRGNLMRSSTLTL